MKKQTYHVQEGRSSPGGGPAVFGAAEPALLRPGSLVDPRHFGTDPDPRILTLTSGSDPALFVSGLQDVNKTLGFFPSFFCLLRYLNAQNLRVRIRLWDAPKLRIRIHNTDIYISLFLDKKS